MPLSLLEKLAIAETVTLFGRLFALDRVRTDYLESVQQPIPDQDMRALSRMTESMDQILEQAASHARVLSLTIEKHSEELEKSYGRIFWTDELTGDQKVRLNAALSRTGHPVEYGLRGAEGVIYGAETERGALTNEMEAIYNGGSAAGDLSSGFLCNMGAACIVGGLLALPPSNIVAVGVGLLMIGQVYAMGEEC